MRIVGLITKPQLQVLCMLEGGIPNSTTHYRLLYSQNPETHLHWWYFPAGIPQHVMLLHYIPSSSSVSLLELLCCNINYNFKNIGTAYADVYTQYSYNFSQSLLKCIMFHLKKKRTVQSFQLHLRVYWLRILVPI